MGEPKNKQSSQDHTKVAVKINSQLNINDYFANCVSQYSLDAYEK